MPPLSVTIITLNEAAHIGAAIDSASWADEVIVVDSGSSDDTVAIARSKGARVDVRPWSGYVDQKNFAATLASHDWIFSLDADERLTPELAAEIRSLLASNPDRAGYRVPRVTYHFGRWIRTTDFYPDFQTRLYDRRRARWHGKYVHESVHVESEPGRLRHELLHYSYRDLRDHLDRINRYSTLAARQMLENGRRAGVVDLLIHPPAAFLRNYILRKGILDGAAGLLLSIVNSYAVFLKFAKLWELQHSPTSQTAESQPANAAAHATQPKAQSSEPRA